MQPEVDIPGVELAHGVKLQLGRAEKRNAFALVLGPGVELVAPMGFKLLPGPIGHLAPQPAGARGKQFE